MPGLLGHTHTHAHTPFTFPTPLPPPRRYVTAVALSPTMPWIATGSMDRTVNVWRMTGRVGETGKMHKRLQLTDLKTNTTKNKLKHILAVVQRALKSFGAQKKLPNVCFSTCPAGDALLIGVQ